MTPAPLPSASPACWSGSVRSGSATFCGPAAWAIFAKAWWRPYIEAGELERVADAPEFTYPAYAVYPEESMTRVDLQAALSALRKVVEAGPAAYPNSILPVG